MRKYFCYGNFIFIEKRCMVVNVITTRRDKKFTRKDKTKMKQYDYLIVGSGLYGAVFCTAGNGKREEGLSYRQTTKHCRKCIHRRY